MPAKRVNQTLAQIVRQHQYRVVSVKGGIMTANADAGSDRFATPLYTVAEAARYPLLAIKALTDTANAAGRNPNRAALTHHRTRLRDAATVGADPTAHPDPGTLGKKQWQVTELARASRLAQRLPEPITDPSVLRNGSVLSAFLSSGVATRVWARALL